MAIGLAAPPQVNISETVTELSAALYYLEDPTGSLAMEDVRKRLDAFKPVPNENPNFGLTSSTYWFVLILRTTRGPEPFVLECEYPLLDSVELHVFSGGRYFSHVRSGDLLPFDTRYRPHRTLNFHIPMAASHTVELFMKAKTEGSMQFPVRLYTEDAFGDHAATENLGLGCYYGAILVVGVFNFVLFGFLRDPIYLSYAAYLVSLLGFQLAANGAMSQYFVPENPAVANASFPVFFFLTVAFATVFSARFNQVPQTAPRLAPILRGVVAFSLAMALGTTVLPYSFCIRVAALCGLVVPVLALVIGVVALKKGFRPARFYLLAWTLFAVGCFVYGLKSVGVLPNVFVTEFAMQIGSWLEVVLLAVALGDKMIVVAGERDMLTASNLQQSRYLVDEIQKRAGAEKRLRQELESKVQLFGNTTHHLNNPLNQILVSNKLSEKAQADLELLLRSLMPDTANQEVQIVRTKMAQLFDTMAASRTTVYQGVERATESVSMLRALSEIDGKSLSRSHPSAIWNAFSRRNPKMCERVTSQGLARDKETAVFGHVGVYAHGLELIFEFLAVKAGVDFQVSIGLDSAIPPILHHELCLQLDKPLEAPLEDLDVLESELAFLLRAYDGWARVSVEGVKFSLLARDPRLDPSVLVE